MKKKSYNPFKMWGAWVGAILYAVIGILSFSGKGLIKMPEGLVKVLFFPLLLMETITKGFSSGEGGLSIALIIAFTVLLISGFLVPAGEVLQWLCLDKSINLK